MGLKVALCQMNIAWCEKEKNLRKAEEFIEAADADIVVLPETFTTGFKTTDASFAENMTGPTVKWFEDVASRYGKAVVGSTMIKENGKYFNRLFFARPGEELLWYDKRHLFSFGGENVYFSRGEKRIIVEYKGFRILPLICYDLRFPVWSRGRNEFDLMIYIASWDNSRIGVWDTLLKARAIENQSYVVGVNRVGHDPTANYEGHSVAVNYYGELMERVDNNKEGMVVAELELVPLRRFREKFRAWEDGDDFEVKI